MKKTLLITLLSLVFLITASFALAGTIDSTYKYAWSSKMGWINFNPTQGSVQVTDTALTGYIWNDAFGWIKLNPTQSGVVNSGGTLSGYAWGDSAGWINFSGVSIDCSGVFSGTATGDIVGTINFDCTNCSVITDWRDSGCGSSSSGGSSSGPVSYHNVCSNEQCIPTVGIGIDQCQADSECAIHNECSNNQCISVSGDGIDQCSTSIDCTTPKHNECAAENQCVVVDGEGDSVCQTNSDCVFHNECSNEQCAPVLGDGEDQCQTDSECAMHNECKINDILCYYGGCVLQCKSVFGEGIDQCQTDSECAILKHNECNEENQCLSVDGEGEDQCQTDSECISHNECSNEQCVVILSPGVNQCNKDLDCTIPKHNECNGDQCVSMDGDGFDVCQIDADCIGSHTECSNKQCIDVAGFGVDQCVGDLDCFAGRYNICNDQKKCLSIEGTGENQCNTDSDCGEGGGGDPIIIDNSHTECNDQKKCVEVFGGDEDECETDEDCYISVIDKPIDDIKEITGIVIENTKKVVAEQTENAKKAIIETKKIIETPVGSVVTKTVATTGAATSLVAIIFNPASIYEMFLIPFRLLGLLLAGLGFRKKFKHWGVVYDSVTKQPIDPAYVMLKMLNGKKIGTAITDLDGRYGFFVSPGKYKLTANKTHYIFPSKKLEGKISDEIYNNLYFGGDINVIREGEVIIKNIPMDPVGFDWNEFSKKSKKLMKFYSKWDSLFRRATGLFFTAGFIVALVAFLAAPYPYNTVIVFSYVALILLRFLGIKPMPLGRIIEKNTGDPLSFAVLRIILPGSNVEISHKIADKYGRYYCLVPKGKYYIKIEKKKSDGSYSLVYTSPVINASKKGIIKEKFEV